MAPVVVGGFLLFFHRLITMALLGRWVGGQRLPRPPVASSSCGDNPMQGHLSAPHVDVASMVCVCARRPLITSDHGQQ